jgi:hypothetical protein
MWPFFGNCFFLQNFDNLQGFEVENTYRVYNAGISIFVIAISMRRKLFTKLIKGCKSLCGLDPTLQDGRSINENYGTDLDKLEEGDRVGVLRTGLGDLIFFVNGIAQAGLTVRFRDRIWIGICF